MPTEDDCLFSPAAGDEQRRGAPRRFLQLIRLSAASEASVTVKRQTAVVKVIITFESICGFKRGGVVFLTSDKSNRAILNAAEMSASN